MRYRYLFAIISVVALVVLAQVVYWRLAAERLRNGFQAWLASQTGHGWTVSSGVVTIGGWPESAAITVPELVSRHAGSAMPGALYLAPAGVLLSVSLLNPTVLHVSLTGPMHVRVGNLPEVVVAGDETALSLPLQQYGPVSLALYGRGLRLDAANGAWHATAGLVTAQAEIAAASPPDQSQPAATFALMCEAIALPGGLKWPLGPNISSLSLNGRLSGPLPKMGAGERDAGERGADERGADERGKGEPGDTERGAERWAEAWRDGGGSLEVTHMTMGWGPLGLTSSATLALDDQLQPMGSGNGRIVGYAETLDRLAAGGMLTKSAATAAKAVLSLMAGGGSLDEPSSVEVPLTLQYRTLSMRQIPLIRLPELDWPSR